MTDKVRSIRPNQRSQHSRLHRLQRGQSLVEVALSLSFLVLMFSGALDLGRAFFTKIMLDSAISEGGNYSTAFPGCLPYGSAWNDGSTIVNDVTTCAGDNNLKQRIKHETSQLIQANIQNITIQIVQSPSGHTLITDVGTGDTVQMVVNYTMPIVTPVMRGMFGDTLTLTSSFQEVVRGSGVPLTAGTPITYTQTPSTLPAPDFVNVAPNYQSPSACTNGYPGIQWKDPAQSGTNTILGYNVYAVDAGTGANALTVSGTAITEPIDTKGYTSQGTVNLSQPMSQTGLRINPQVGGVRLYGVQSYNTTGSPILSDELYVLVTCVIQEPTNLAYACASYTAPATMPASMSLTWTAPTPTDTYVTGYDIYTTTTNSKVGTVSGGSTTTWNYTFVDPNPTGSPPVLDPLRTATFYVMPYNGTSGTNFGVDNSGNTSSTTAGHVNTSGDTIVSCTS